VAPGGLQQILILGVVSMVEGLLRWLVGAGAPSVVVAAEVVALVLCRVPAVVTGLRRWCKLSIRGVMGRMW
jgi:hypothetical protein